MTTNNKRFFLDVHAIQTIPPSNVNRDDTGSPKTAQYGGVTRARVSSQSWKKAMRRYFLENGDLGNVGVRSLEIVRYIADKIMTLDNSKDKEKAMNLAKEILDSAKISLTKDLKTKALFFISSRQAENLARIALEGKLDKKDIKEMFKKEPAIDIALFGRMVADETSLNEDASSQVAHAISTHVVQTEFDFFTATDDFSSTGDAGAGMLGTVEYNSSTLYRYANVAIHEFYKQIGNVNSVVNSLSLFVEAFAKSMPTGKINTFANQTLPQAVLVCIRQDRPVSLVSAFECPVKSNERGYIEESINKLKEEFEAVKKWVDKSLFVFSLGMDDFEGKNENFNQLLENLKDKLTILLNN